jgi:hypothetical protein
MRFKNLPKTTKKLYMLSAVLAIVCIGLGIEFLSSSDQIAGVLGVQDVPTVTTPSTTPVQLQPSPNKDQIKNASAALGEQKLTNGEYSLVGSGCTGNEFGSLCELKFQNQSKLLLKDCSIADNANCNFYIYTLGATKNTGVYILQSFDEEPQLLTDVLEYDLATNTSKVIDTVLFENLSAYQACTNTTNGSCINLQEVDVDPESIKNKVQTNNQDYLNTINKYK